MKYYATLEAEPERSRIAKKGSNAQLNIKLYKGNKEVGLITFGGGEVGIEVYEPREVYAISPEDGVELKVPSGEVRFII